MTMRMVSAVTPSDVAPPFTAPLGHGTTHCGANRYGTLTLPVAGSQSGAASAAADPTPGAPTLAWGAAAPVPAKTVVTAVFVADCAGRFDWAPARATSVGVTDVGVSLEPSDDGA